jgi:hypothetical protein
VSKAIVKTVYLYKNGYKTFRIGIEDPGEYKDTSFNAVVEEITSWEVDKDKTSAESELYLTCYIKWDSCSHFWFGEKEEEGGQNGYLHICGAEYYKNHVDLMNYLYYLAFKRMGREPYDEREKWELDLKVLSDKGDLLESREK